MNSEDTPTRTPSPGTAVAVDPGPSSAIEVHLTGLLDTGAVHRGAAG
jgi:hypothetical protein